MKNLIKILICVFSLLTFESTFAYESQLSFSTTELMRNEDVKIGVSMDKKSETAMCSTAAGVLSLQLRQVCSKAIVLCATYKKSVQYDFTVSSPDCKIKGKADGDCDPLFEAKNMPPNPNNKAAVIIGADTHKVCVRTPAGSGDSSSGVKVAP